MAEERKDEDKEKLRLYEGIARCRPFTYLGIGVGRNPEEARDNLTNRLQWEGKPFPDEVMMTEVKLFGYELYIRRLH